MPTIAPIVNRPIDKHPLSHLPYSWIFTDWLNKEKDSILPVNGVSVALDSGLSAGSAPWHDDGVVHMFIDGGTLGQIQKAVCRIVTTGGRIEYRTLFLNITDKR